MLLQSGNGAMHVLKRTTLMKIETQLKIGTKPMKMLLRCPKIQKGCRMSFSRLGMAIYFTLSVGGKKSLSTVAISRENYDHHMVGHLVLFADALSIFFEVR